MRWWWIWRDAVYVPLKLDNHCFDSQKDVWVLWQVVGELGAIVCWASVFVLIPMEAPSECRARSLRDRPNHVLGDYGFELESFICSSIFLSAEPSLCPHLRPHFVWLMLIPQYQLRRLNRVIDVIAESNILNQDARFLPFYQFHPFHTFPFSLIS